MVKKHTGAAESMAPHLEKGLRFAGGSECQGAYLKTEGSCDPFPWTCVTPALGNEGTGGAWRCVHKCAACIPAQLHFTVFWNYCFSGMESHTSKLTIRLILQLFPDVLSTALEQICVFNTDLIFNRRKDFVHAKSIHCGAESNAKRWEKKKSGSIQGGLVK